MRRPILPLLLAAFGFLLLPRAAAAYIGPGAGISVIGTVVAVVGAVAFAILGFVWYPIKRLVSAIRGSRRAEPTDPRAETR